MDEKPLEKFNLLVPMAIHAIWGNLGAKLKKKIFLGSSMCHTFPVHHASVNLHWKFSPSALRLPCVPRLFPGDFWRPSQYPN